MFSTVSRVSSSTPIAKRDKKRSRSVEPAVRSRVSYRSPALKFDEDEDTATRTCIEISRSMMREPNVSTGRLFETASNSRRDIHKSDAVIVISAAILAHLGNSTMATETLKKSNTCKGYYTKMGLEDNLIREMFVTMLFALNPNFVTMVERSLIISLTRATKIGTDEYSGRQMVSVVKTLHDEGTIVDDDLITMLTPKTPTLVPKMAARYHPVFDTPIHPNDSVSLINAPVAARRRISEKDINTYIKRRKEGQELEFESVFPSASAPIRLKANRGKAGLGYVARQNQVSEFDKLANNVLGSLDVRSVNLNTGAESRRKPRVEDFLESEETSESVMYQPPDSENNNWQNLDKSKMRPPSPTELYLPDSVANQTTATTQVPKRMDSYEALMASLRV